MSWEEGRTLVEMALWLGLGLGMVVYLVVEARYLRRALREFDDARVAAEHLDALLGQIANLNRDLAGERQKVQALDEAREQMALLVPSECCTGTVEENLRAYMEVLKAKIARQSAHLEGVVHAEERAHVAEIRCRDLLARARKDPPTTPDYRKAAHDFLMENDVPKHVKCGPAFMELLQGCFFDGAAAVRRQVLGDAGMAPGVSARRSPKCYHGVPWNLCPEPVNCDERAKRERG